MTRMVLVAPMTAWLPLMHTTASPRLAIPSLTHFSTATPILMSSAFLGLITTAPVPLRSPKHCRAVRTLGVSTVTLTGGRNLATCRAVVPEAEHTMIPTALRSMAVLTAEEAMDSPVSMDPKSWSVELRTAW